MVAATSPALYLLALACPISMGVMMVWMMKGMNMGGKKDRETRDEASLASLKAEQARLAEKIAELEARRTRTEADETNRTPAQRA